LFPKKDNNNKSKKGGSNVAAASSLSGSGGGTAAVMTLQDRNIQIAWYAVAIVVGVLGATYASVPLYKVFCQATGFGGTTQRVGSVEYDMEKATEIEKFFIQAMQRIRIFYRTNIAPNVPSATGSGVRTHTWTDEDAMAKLSQLRPVKDANLINVYFDTTTSDVLPWSFTPIVKNVKVVPGETSLSFFRVTNHSDKPITGVATYNVYPPKMGLYFQKVQCFCFEEQRLLPGETVDMPVFYFIDPEVLKDPQVSYVTNMTLSYTFFMTDEEEDDDDDEDEDDDETGNQSNGEGES